MSCQARQTTSGRSPGLATNSKSAKTTSSKSLSVFVTRGPPLEERVLGGIDEMPPVAERQPEDFRVLECRPDRVSEPPRRRGVDPVASILLVGVQTHPFGRALDQAEFLRAVIFVLLSVRVGTTDGDDLDGASRGHRQIERVERDGDAYCRQCSDHLVGNGEELPLHTDFEIDDRNHWPEVRVRSKKFIPSRYLGHADRDNADRAGTAHAGQIAAQRAEFLLVLV